MARQDILFGVILTAFGAVMIAVSRGFPAITGLPVGPSLFPTLIGGGLCAFGLLIAARALRDARAGDAGTDPGADRFLTWHLALISGLILVFLVSVHHLGFSLATAVVIFALLRVYHREKLLTDLVLTVVAVLAVFVIFSFVFRVPLPVGPVEKLIFQFFG